MDKASIVVSSVEPWKTLETSLARKHAHGGAAKTMKKIVALLIAQASLISFVIVKLVNIEGRIDNHEAAFARVSPHAIDFEYSQSTSAPTGMSVLSEQKLREVIREELAANIATSAHFEVDRYRNPEPGRVDTPEYQYRLERVAQQLNYFESVGEVSNKEIEELHAQIAKLHPADRRAILSRLVQSMNAGRIKGLL